MQATPLVQSYTVFSRSESFHHGRNQIHHTPGSLFKIGSAGAATQTYSYVSNLDSPSPRAHIVHWVKPTTMVLGIVRWNSNTVPVQLVILLWGLKTGNDTFTRSSRLSSRSFYRLDGWVYYFTFIRRQLWPQRTWLATNLPPRLLAFELSI